MRQPTGSKKKESGRVERREKGNDTQAIPRKSPTGVDYLSSLEKKLRPALLQGKVPRGEGKTAASTFLRITNLQKNEEEKKAPFSGFFS